MGEHVYVARLAGRQVDAVSSPREGGIRKLAAAEVADARGGRVRQAYWFLNHFDVGERLDVDLTSAKESRIQKATTS